MSLHAKLGVFRLVKSTPTNCLREIFGFNDRWLPRFPLVTRPCRPARSCDGLHHVTCMQTHHKSAPSLLDRSSSNVEVTWCFASIGYLDVNGSICNDIGFTGLFEQPNSLILFVSMQTKTSYAVDSVGADWSASSVSFFYWHWMACIDLTRFLILLQFTTYGQMKNPWTVRLANHQIIVISYWFSCRMVDNKWPI